MTSENELRTKRADAGVALITGGSRGIGRAICIALAAEGYQVAINYSNSLEEAEETFRLCQATAATAAAQQFALVKGDVATEEGCAQIYQQTVEALGEPSVLVNNAGITRDNLILRLSVADFDRVIDVNLRSAFILSKLACRSMAKKRFGRIINISSVVGLVGNAGQTNYAASKAGIIGLTKSLARELGSRSVTVNAVAPGFIQTSMTAALDEQVRQNLAESIALGRLGTPEDVAAAVVFLAGEAAGYITGQVLSVDGGMAF